jgi:hypothetical protein
MAARRVDFVPMPAKIAQSPATFTIAEELRVTRAQVIGHLYGLFLWAMEFAPDGEVGAFPDSALAFAAGWTGDPSKLVDALKTQNGMERYLEVGGRTRLRIVDWAETGGKLHRKRTKNAERMREARSQEALQIDESCVAQDAHITRTEDAHSRALAKSKSKSKSKSQGLKNMSAAEGAADVDDEALYLEKFELAWKLLPRRRNASKKAAWKAWKARVRAGADPDTLVLAAKRYGEVCRRDCTEERYVLHGATFFGPDERWVVYLPSTNGDGDDTLTEHPLTEHDTWALDDPNLRDEFIRQHGARLGLVPWSEHEEGA